MPRCRHVYIKLAEAKDIKATDTYAVVSVDGKKTAPLRTSLVSASSAPSWNQEFLVSVPEGDPDVDIFVYNNLKNKVIGKLKLKIMRVPIDAIQYDWMKLDKKGSIRVVYKVPALKEYKDGAPELELSEKLPRMRLHMERESYYPGEKVRGIIVFNRHKPKKNATLSLSFRSYSKIATLGALKTESKHEMHRIVASKPLGDIPVGCHSCPFEFVLPLDTLPTKTLGKPPHSFNRTIFKAEVQSEGGVTKKARAEIEVLPSRPFTLPRVPTLMGPSTEIGKRFDDLAASDLADKDKVIWWKLTGPAQMFAGETYTFHAKIRHFGKPTVAGLSVKMMMEYWYCGKAVDGESAGKWVRRAAMVFLNDLTFPSSGKTTHENISVAPGAEWEGDLTVQIPDNLETSIHASDSPLLNVAYYMTLTPMTRIGPSLTPVTGMEFVNGAPLRVCVLNANASRAPIPETQPRAVDSAQGMGPIFVWWPNDSKVGLNSHLTPNVQLQTPQYFGDLAAHFPTSAPTSCTNAFPQKTGLSAEEWAGHGELPLVYSQVVFARPVPDDDAFSDKNFIQASQK